MNETKALNRIRHMAEEVAQREGCILYDLEIIGQGSTKTLRVYIDKDQTHSENQNSENDRENNSEKSSPVGTGASIDDCANISRGLGLMLDVEDPMGDGAYELEVSTPGLERVLKQTWHFEKAVGKSVQVNANTELPVPEAVKVRKAPKSLTGQLCRASEEAIELESHDVVWVIPRSIIHKAKVKFVFEHPGAKKHQAKKNLKKKDKR